MKICDILKEDKIISDFSGKTKEEVINQLIDLFQKDTRVNDLEKIRTAVLEREKIMSTGVGNGFAIPHGKTDGVNEIIAGFARIPATIDFQALDDKPVNLVFLLVGKENLVGPHIKLLSRISRMMNKEQFRNDLLAADTPAKIYEIFQNEEKNYFDIT
ncbi:MAG: PTS sugar transporter subunit IIA [Ignavibacteria bacterium]|nr:PTS sugar transporter subunit IIA [Ignavibacteria bacterium]